MKKIMVLIVLVVFCIDAKVIQRVQDGQVVASRPVTRVPVSAPVIEVDQDDIKKRLDQQLNSPVEGAWDDRIKDVFDLATVNPSLAQDYFVKMREKMAAAVKPIEAVKPLEPSVPVAMPAPVPVPEIKVDQDAVKKRLDQQLSSPVETAWDDRVNDVFDLAMVNRESARDYFVKMREKMASEAVVKPIEVVTSTAPVAKELPATEVTTPKEKEVVASTLPEGAEPMKIGAGRPASPKKFGAPKVEAEAPKVEGVAAGEESMTVSKQPAPVRKLGAPPGKPAAKVTSSTKPAGGPVAGKPGEAPKKVAEQIFSLAQLKKLKDDTLLALFNELLEKLGTVPVNWNSTIVEKIEEKTKYGSKTYNAYGAPIPKWTNDIGTVKKALIEKKIMTEEEASQKIKDRIAQVRSEKNIKPAASAQPEEKAKEELTEEDLVKLIKGLLAVPKETEIGWIVSIKANLRALDKINHESAMEYHNKFIALTKEKPFLK